MTDEKESAMNVNGGVNKEQPLIRRYVHYLTLALLLSISVGGYLFFEDLSAQKARNAHQWALAIETSPFFEAEVNFYIPKIILAGGIIISLLIFLILKIVGDSDRRAESLARQISEVQVRSLMNNSPIGFALLDTDGHFLDVNAALCQMTGYPREELCRNTLQVITHPQDLNTDVSYVRQMLKGEINAYWIKKRYIHKDGHTIWGLLCVSLVNKKDGSPDYFISQYVDISAEIKSEQNHIAMLTAEAANRQKSQFLSNMSHEIRTPMNAILGFAQVLDRDPALNPGQKEQIRIINRSGRHLLRLIDDILDISRIESGKVELSSVVFGLEEFLDDMENMFRSRAEAKDLQLIVERDGELPAWVYGDEGKLRQVLINLLGNAVKFTERGWIRLRAHSEPAAEQAGDEKKSLLLLFEIEDSGPGIAKSEQERIFHAFEQVEVARIVEGTGLGLAISHRLVEIMGGTLTVDSKEGDGSCFYFSVLCEPADSIQKSEVPKMPEVLGLEPGSGPWRVLVVDDVMSNRDLLYAMLLPLGFEIQHAENGTEAIDIFEKWSPHVVLMDMRMPMMDGYEATRRIKATEKGRTTPVIAVTASVLMGREDEVMDMGVSAYLRKPFKPEELYEILGEYLDLRYVYADETSETPQEEPKAAALTPEYLAAFPDELLRNMRKSVAEGDMIRLTELIRQVEALDVSAALGLKTLADQYDYTKLNELLGKKGN
ncbi:MAG: PAS domain S-box protein [Desulfamplus sp.]|nr:PAS domain S-box protein [Desulfamplus sp.]